MSAKPKKAHLLLLILSSLFIFIMVDNFLSKKIKGLTHDKYIYTQYTIKEQLNEAIHSKSSSTLNLALALSENNSYKQFLKNGKDFDIDLKKVSLKIKNHSNFKNVWIQLIDKNGISKYRNWSPKRNDNISLFRKELPALLKNPKIESVISVGIYDMTFKSIVPIYYKEKFLGIIEVITKINSIAEDFKRRGLDIVVLVDDKYKNQITKPFTNEFINDYYVTNVNAKKELKDILKDNIEEYITIDKYKLINNYFVTTYTLKDISGQNMSYFVIFKDKQSIDLEDIHEFENFIRLIGILLGCFIIAILVAIYFYNKAKYTSVLEKDVKKRTKELNDLTKRYHQIFEGSKAIKLIIDPKSRNIIDVNNAAVDFYGYRKDYFLKLKSKILENLSEEDFRLVQKKILENKQNIFIQKHTLKSGEIRDVEIYASPIQINQKVYIYALVRDITNELKAKEELEKKQKLFYQQSKMASMGEMIENIAHQWRQPLSTITTAASGTKIKKDFGELDDEFFNDSMDIIIKSANYLSHTIDDFRDFFKQSKNKEEFELLPIIKNSIKLANLKNKDIEIIINCPDMKILGYKNELIQVFLNILNNAKDALREKKDTPKVIKIDVKQSHNKIIFSIIDNAGGVDENNLEKIFEPYFTTKHKAQGTGIGLYMSEQIITKHFKGEIDVQNLNFVYKDKDYFGANFKIIIPNNLNS
jgi:PAS domain S-box-containing protein